MKQSAIEEVRTRLNTLLYAADGQPTHFLKQLIEETFDAMVASESYTLSDAEEGVKHFKAVFQIKPFDLNMTLRGK